MGTGLLLPCQKASQLEESNRLPAGARKGGRPPERQCWKKRGTD